MESYTKKPALQFFRICHVCGTNNSDTHPVERCLNCGKCMAPFFYFNDQYVSIYADNELRPPLMSGEYGPLRGLTAYWSEEG